MADESTEQVTESNPRSLGNFESEEYKKSKQEASTEVTTENPTTQTEEQTGAAATETTQPKVTQETSELTDEQYWKEISDQVGFPVTSEAEIFQHLKAKRELELELEKERKKYGGLSPLAIDIDRAEKAGLDYNQYMKARNLQVEKLDDYNAIKEKFFLENKDMVAMDPEFAKMEFERTYKAKYGILTTELDEIQKVEKENDIAYAAKAQRFEAEQSKKFLAEWKAKNVTIPESSPNQGPTEEEQTQLREQYLSQASDFADGLDVLEVPVGDKVFKYDLKDHIDQIKADITNPVETLKRFGFDVVNGTVDSNLFGELLVKLYAIDNIIEPITAWHLEQSNAQTVKQKLEGPAPTQRQSGGPDPEKTHDQKLGEAFQALFRNQRQA